jgi:hypothetical protein
LKHDNPLHDWDYAHLAAHGLKLSLNPKYRTGRRPYDQFKSFRIDQGWCLSRHEPQQPTAVFQVNQWQSSLPADSAKFQYHRIAEYLVHHSSAAPFECHR